MTVHQEIPGVKPEDSQISTAKAELVGAAVLFITGLEAPVSTPLGIASLVAAGALIIDSLRRADKAD